MWPQAAASSHKMWAGCQLSGLESYDCGGGARVLSASTGCK